MPARKQVTCITKTDRQDAHERISHIGGNGWRETEDHAICDIEAGLCSYYTYVNYRMAELIVATKGDHKYLKTVADGDQPDNLLSLPECP